MLKKVFVSLFFAGIAFVILFISILRSASVHYEFGDSKIDKMDTPDSEEVNYYLAYPGRVMPDSPIWSLKVLRDKVWLRITTDGGKKAELLLLFADKRISASQILFDQNKPELAYSVLEKSQMYLIQAMEQTDKNKEDGYSITDFNIRLANASLKHYEVMQNILNLAPDDAKPKIIQLQNGPKKVFEFARNSLLEKGQPAPINPFNW